MSNSSADWREMPEGDKRNKAIAAWIVALICDAYLLIWNESLLAGQGGVL